MEISGQQNARRIVAFKISRCRAKLLYEIVLKNVMSLYDLPPSSAHKADCTQTTLSYSEEGSLKVDSPIMRRGIELPPRTLLARGCLRSFFKMLARLDIMWV